MFGFKKKPEVPETSGGFFSRLKAGLNKTSSSIAQGITAALTHRKLDAEALQGIEDQLLMADLGPAVATQLKQELATLSFQPDISPEQVRAAMAHKLASLLEPYAKPIELTQKPHVIMMVGVNGTGKTTTVGKLAARYADEGKKVMIAAGDTYRAAAISQLAVWAERAGCKMVAGEQGGDAAGLVFNAYEAARAEGADVLLVDTAGRLHNRDDLMAELAKIVRVIKKIDAAAPHAVLLVLDATTGQNALQQAEVFSKMVAVSGFVLTKLDGTAKGGILVALTERFKLPVHAVGVGEGIDDLRPFAAKEFAAALMDAPLA